MHCYVFLLEFLAHFENNLLDNFCPMLAQSFARSSQTQSFRVPLFNLPDGQFPEDLFISRFLSNNLKNFIELFSFIFEHIEVLLVRCHVCIVASVNTIIGFLISCCENNFYLLSLIKNHMSKNLLTEYFLLYKDQQSLHGKFCFS